MKKKNWYNYLWILSLLYLTLGFFNIGFAWLGMLCMVIPVLIAAFGGGKAYCNRYCGRGQLFTLLGNKCGLSLKKKTPAFLTNKWFRYGFLAFFMIMFSVMLWNTYLVFAGAVSLKQVVTLLWAIKLPWNWAYTVPVTPWAAQFAFGFYSIILTSTLIGLVTMMLFKPRSWCAYCPMGTMTQIIAQSKSKKRFA